VTPAADSAATLRRITVGGVAPYDVVIGRGTCQALPSVLGTQVRHVAVLHPPVLTRMASRVAALLDDAGYQPLLVTVPAAEAAKDITVAAEVWSRLGQSGFGRDDAIIGLGGGATTDLAGFVAGTWQRGVAVVHIPTTLLAMVDAAVGGKTGVNTAEGKNLVGVIHPPSGVIVDLDVLGELPADEFIAGLAEVVKIGFIADPVILDLIEADPVAAINPQGPLTRQLVERSIQVKATVVAADLRERLPGGGREILNYGHTFGHAIERVESYRWRHGSAVSVGMMYVAELASLAGLASMGMTARHRAILTSVGLPVSYRQGNWQQLLAAMRVDKKSRGGNLRFVVLTDVGKPTILEGPAESLLELAYARISAPQEGSR
jgi:3-dehydroquinate synthase